MSEIDRADELPFGWTVTSAPGIVRRPSTFVTGVEERTPKKSQIAFQNPSRSSTDQRQSAS